jgi:hypothetical protein
MMPETLTRSKLHVEGIDDQHTVIHLLIRNGVQYHPDKFDLSPPELPQLEQLKGITTLIDGIIPAVKISTNRTIGFLLDADSPLLDRWRSVAEQLRQVGVENLPAKPPEGGFIGTSPQYKANVGVWLMPDNVQDGKLEDFLRTLISERDTLIGHAETATDQAKALGAAFTDADRIKAIIHAWLAWQDEPGRPYGLAMKAKYFRHDLPSALMFVKWFKVLYNLT